MSRKRNLLIEIEYMLYLKTDYLGGHPLLKCLNKLTTADILLLKQALHEYIGDKV